LASHSAEEGGISGGLVGVEGLDAGIGFWARLEDERSILSTVCYTASEFAFKSVSRFIGIKIQS
jgi:hypothetical protein